MCKYVHVYPKAIIVFRGVRRLHLNSTVKINHVFTSICGSNDTYSLSLSDLDYIRDINLTINHIKRVLNPNKNSVLV